jgi:hypothetical protein
MLPEHAFAARKPSLPYAALLLDYYLDVSDEWAEALTAHSSALRYTVHPHSHICGVAVRALKRTL